MSKYRVVSYSILLPNNHVTQYMFSDKHDRRIAKIKRKCHCDIHLVDGISVEWCGVQYLLIEIRYHDARGNHVGCMSMIESLSKTMRQFSYISLNLLPYDCTLRNENGKEYTISFRNEKGKPVSEDVSIMTNVNELIEFTKKGFVAPPSSQDDVSSISQWDSNSHQTLFPPGVDVEQSQQSRTPLSVASRQLATQATPLPTEITRNTFESCMSNGLSFCKSEFMKSEISPQSFLHMQQTSGAGEEKASDRSLVNSNCSTFTTFGRTTERTMKYREISVFSPITRDLDTRASDITSSVTILRDFVITETCSISGDEEDIRNEEMERVTDLLIEEVCKEGVYTFIAQLARFFGRCKEALPELSDKVLLKEMFIILDEELKRTSSLDYRGRDSELYSTEVEMSKCSSVRMLENQYSMQSEPSSNAMIDETSSSKPIPPKQHQKDSLVRGKKGIRSKHGLLMISDKRDRIIKSAISDVFVSTFQSVLQTSTARVSRHLLKRSDSIISRLLDDLAPKVENDLFEVFYSKGIQLETERAMKIEVKKASSKNRSSAAGGKATRPKKTNDLPNKDTSAEPSCCKEMSDDLSYNKSTPTKLSSYKESSINASSSRIQVIHSPENKVTNILSPDRESSTNLQLEKEEPNDHLNGKRFDLNARPGTIVEQVEIDIFESIVVNIINNVTEKRLETENIITKLVDDSIVQVEPNIFPWVYDTTVSNIISYKIFLDNYSISVVNPIECHLVDELYESLVDEVIENARKEEEETISRLTNFVVEELEYHLFEWIYKEMIDSKMDDDRKSLTKKSKEHAKNKSEISPKSLKITKTEPFKHFIFTKSHGTSHPSKSTGIASKNPRSSNRSKKDFVDSEYKFGFNSKSSCEGIARGFNMNYSILKNIIISVLDVEDTLFNWIYDSLLDTQAIDLLKELEEKDDKHLENEQIPCCPEKPKASTTTHLEFKDDSAVVNSKLKTSSKSTRHVIKKVQNQVIRYLYRQTLDQYITDVYLSDKGLKSKNRKSDGQIHGKMSDKSSRHKIHRVSDHKTPRNSERRVQATSIAAKRFMANPYSKSAQAEILSVLNSDKTQKFLNKYVDVEETRYKLYILKKKLYHEISEELIQKTIKDFVDHLAFQLRLNYESRKSLKYIKPIPVISYRKDVRDQNFAPNGDELIYKNNSDSQGKDVFGQKRINEVCVSLIDSYMYPGSSTTKRRTCPRKTHNLCRYKL